MTEKKPTVGDYFRSASCTSDPQTNAVNALRNKELTVFTDLINEPDKDARDVSYPLAEGHWINLPISEQDDKTLLILAIESRAEEFVKNLILAGAKVDCISPEYGKAPLHFAAETGCVALLKLLLQHENNCPDINGVMPTNGRTALHISVEKNHKDCVLFLLRQPGIKLDVQDNKRGQTPLYLAVKGGHTDLVTLLLQNGADADLECFGKKILRHIKEKLPMYDPDPHLKPKTWSSNDLNDDLNTIILNVVNRAGSELGKISSESEFKAILRGMSMDKLRAMNFGGSTLLQKVIREDLAPHAEFLVHEMNVDPNETGSSNKMPPLIMTAKMGNISILKLLLTHTNIDIRRNNPGTKETFLHCLLKYDGDMERDKQEECLRYVLHEAPVSINSVVNSRDIHENTAIHYATQNWNQDVVRNLMELGANIGMKNQWEEIPINKITPETMEDFLDNFCMDSKGEVNDSKFELTFNYSFLAPAKEDLPFYNRNVTIEPEAQSLSDQDKKKKVPLPETDTLWYMSQSQKHQYLLKHPVITSFLFLKWKRIRRYFNKNLRFYLLFTYILTWYIFEQFGHLGDTPSKSIGFWHGLFIPLAFILFGFVVRDWILDIKEVTKKTTNTGSFDGQLTGKECIIVCLKNWIEVAYVGLIGFILIEGGRANVLWAVLLILSLMLLLREVLQLLVSVKRYMSSPENWLEVTLLVLIAFILLGSEENEDFKRHLASISIVLSWAELITLVGRHPNLTQCNVYVMMFYKVMGTFFVFLSWYAFFIVAFGLGFYIMLHKKPDEEQGEDDYTFFNNPWLALVKTSTMFVGELEFSDIPINLGSSLACLAYIFFLSFVFLIVVVLMNLLNGLAVSDTGVIQEKEEIISYVSRVNTISYTESVLLGDPFNFLSNWPALRWLSRVPSCSLTAQLYRNQRLQRFFHRITGNIDLLLFYKFLPDMKLKISPNKKRATCLLQLDLPADIIQAAKDKIVAKNEQQKEDSIHDRLTNLEQKVNEIYDLLLLQKN